MTDKIQRDIEQALAEPDVREKFASFAYEPFVLNRTQFNAYIQAESKNFGVIIKKAQVALD